MSASTIQVGKLPALLLRAPDGAEATITLYGAHLVSWKSVSGTGGAPQERMFMSSLSALDGSRALRGGVPVIFPQFAERGSGMRHGFARVSTWRVLDSGEQDGGQLPELNGRSAHDKILLRLTLQEHQPRFCQDPGRRQVIRLFASGGL